MAEAKAVFAFDVETGAMVEGTNAAVKSLSTLKDTIEKEKAGLKELEAQMKLLQSSGAVDIKQYKTLKDSINAKRQAVQKSSEEYTKLGGKLTDIGKKTKATASEVKPLGVAMSNLGSKIGALPGPAGEAGSALGRLGPALANPYVLAAALAAGLVVAAVAIGAFALASADAARTSRIMIAAMAGGEAAGARLGGAISKLAHDLPMAKEQLQGIAQSLADKGLKGSALESALGAVARTTSVLGQGAASKLDAVITKSKDLKRFTAQALDFTGSGIALDDVATALAARTGKTMAQARESIKAGAVDLATGLQALDDATKTKLGASAKALSLSFSSIGERAKNGLGGIFSGLKIEPILEGLSSIVDLLDESTETGKALRAIAEVALQPLIDFAGGQGQGLVSFFKSLVIRALQFAIMVMQAKNALKAFAQDPIGSLSKLGEKLVDLGSALIDGLVKGIKDGADKVVGAIGGVVDGGVKAAKEKLGIKSPSKVFQKFGSQTVEGYTIGVDAEAPKAQAAVAQAMPLPETSPAGAGRAGRSGPMVVIERLVVEGGGKGIDLEALRRVIIQILEDAVRSASGQAVAA